MNDTTYKHLDKLRCIYMIMNFILMTLVFANMFLAWHIIAIPVMCIVVSFTLIVISYTAARESRKRMMNSFEQMASAMAGAIAGEN